MVRRGTISGAALFAVMGSGAALAEGHHLGWCLGVGNPHHSAYCGSGPSLPPRPAITGRPGGTPDPTDQIPMWMPDYKPPYIVDPDWLLDYQPVTTQLPQTPQPQLPQQIIAGSLQPGPGDVTGPFGGGPNVLPPPVLTIPQQVAPQPMPVVPGQVPQVTALESPPLAFVSHQIVVGTVTVPQVVVNATGQAAQAVPGQIVLTPMTTPVDQPSPSGGAVPQPPALIPALPGGGAAPQGVPGAQVPGAVLVPILSPNLPGGGTATPQGVPGGQIPAQILVPVMVPSLPGGGGAVPQGVPNPQVPGQILVPVLQPPLPGGGGQVPQGVPNPQVPGQILVPVLQPPLPGSGGQVPQGVPNPQVPGQILVPVLQPPLPGGGGQVPQGVPNSQVPGQILVPVLQPPLPGGGGAVPQGVPNPQGTGGLQPPPLRPPLVGQVQTPPTMAVVVFTRPKPRPVLVPPTTVLQTVITHSPTVTKPPVGSSHVTALPGRQDASQPPAFADPGGGGNWNCVASGHGPRAVLKGGRWITAGVERHVGNVDALGRDVPAKHPKHPHCIIGVQRRDGN